MIIIKRVYFICSLLICALSFLVTINAETNEKLIIIDAGHGGTDGGAQANGILESDLNLEIAFKLRDIFIENGYYVDMTREDKNSLCESKFIKKDDMNKRVNMINSKEYICFISIHQNTFPNPIYKGAQVFYSNINESSKILAENIQNSFSINLKNTNRKATKRDNVYLLNKAIIPGVIIECGFLTNKEESDLLKTYEYQKMLAYAIYSAVEKTF